MTPHRSQQQLFLPPAPTNPSSTIRCKTCKAPLPSAAWKNCDNCRRKRTASFHRWKQSAELRKSSSFSTTSAPFQTGRMSLNPSTSSHSHGPASGRSAPLDHGSSDHRPGPSRPTTNGRQPRTTTPAAQPLRLQATERQFQRSDELVDALSVLAPRSEFIGRFSIVADPAVSNIMRARMFADHLRAKALPISENAAPLRFDPSKNSCALLIPCTCQEACIGRFIVTVDDDTSHPCGVPGQRIGAILLHQKSLIQNLPL